jgi:hypothetical protein
MKYKIALLDLDHPREAAKLFALESYIICFFQDQIKIKYLTKGSKKMLPLMILKSDLFK